MASVSSTKFIENFIFLQVFHDLYNLTRLSHVLLATIYPLLATLCGYVLLGGYSDLMMCQFAIVINNATFPGVWPR